MFEYRLALALGYPHPDHLLACLTSSQLAGWMAYSSLEPFGETRQELRHGQHLAMMANLERDPKQRPAPWVAADFMNFIEKPEAEEPESTELETKLASIFG